MSNEYDLFYCAKCEQKFEVEETITNCFNCYHPANEWISVKDRLPKKSSYVLVYGCIDSVPQIGTARYESYDSKFETDHICETSFFYDVTHWMPLPEPPNDCK